MRQSIVKLLLLIKIPMIVKKRLKINYYFTLDVGLVDENTVYETLKFYLNYNHVL